MANTAPVIEVTDVVAEYDSHRALDGVSLCVSPGRITALLGPNGAGKTTLVDILEGFTRPASGLVSLATLATCVVL